MELNETQEAVTLQCASCNSPVREADYFCGNCGKELDRATQHTDSKEDVFNSVGPTLMFYFVNLILFAVYKFTSVVGQDFQGVIVVSVIDIVLVLGFAYYFRKSLVPLYSIRKVSPSIVIITLLGAVAAALIVHVVGNFINVALFDETGLETWFVEETAHPFLWATLLICVQPAIFEELTFRGFIYNNVSQVTSTTGAILISSFMFGFLHLSFISLLWLIPLGLVAAWLRSKYDTLWYGMVAHFCYNFTVVALERF